MDIWPKRILKSKRFVGTYQEKRFCKDTAGYKDIIVVKSSLEPNLSLDLNLVLDVLSSSPKWIGLTAVPEEKEFCIWTDLGEEAQDMPFDDYEFEIRTVRTTDSEVQLKLRVLGKRDPNKSCSTVASEGVSFDISAVNWSDFEPKKILNNVLRFLLSIQWNWAAIKQSLEFVMVTLVYLISELPNIIRFVGEFTLRAFRELSNLIHVCTPIFMAIIDMLSKICGVVLMLITDVIRSSRGGRGQPAPPPPAIQQQQQHQSPRQLMY